MGGISAWWWPNMRLIMDDIREGKLDFVVLKPIIAQFYVSFAGGDLRLATSRWGSCWWGWPRGSWVGLTADACDVLVCWPACHHYYSFWLCWHDASGCPL